MQYTVEITLELPRERVIELFDDPDNLPKWQKGLQSFEPISGTPGEVGATSRLRFQMGKRRLEMVETITRRELPDHFDGTYETQGVFNVVKNQFIAVSSNQTRWVSENEFRFTTLMMKGIELLMKGAFPKQSLKYMEDFKAFAERGVDVRQG